MKLTLLNESGCVILEQGCLSFTTLRTNIYWKRWVNKRFSSSYYLCRAIFSDQAINSYTFLFCRNISNASHWRILGSCFLFPEFNILCFHKAIETYTCDSTYISYVHIIFCNIKYFMALKYWHILYTHIKSYINTFTCISSSI